jgi:hypothetical protein
MSKQEVRRRKKNPPDSAENSLAQAGTAAPGNDVEDGEIDALLRKLLAIGPDPEASEVFEHRFSVSNVAHARIYMFIYLIFVQPINS